MTDCSWLEAARSDAGSLINARMVLFFQVARSMKGASLCHSNRVSL